MRLLTKRERDIIQLAHNLYPHAHKLDEATIDAEFLFHFQPGWCEWVSKIRGMIRAMMGQTDDEPLSLEDGIYWRLHMERNAGVQAVIEIGPDGTKHTVTTTSGNGYCCLDKKLSEEHWEQVIKGNKAEAERLWLQIWAEALQTGTIWAELRRLARAYDLVPPEHELNEYSPNEVKQRFQRVVNWVMWGETVPSFRWPVTWLIESKIRSGVKRTIHPHPGITGHWHERENGSRVWVEDDPYGTRRSRMMKEVRVRTWTIYYLTRRGGGERSEQEAVDLWNDEFNDNVAVKNFRSERDRLFSRGTKSA